MDKISLFPLTRLTLSKSADLIFFLWCRHFFFLVSLKIPYFRFVSPKDRYLRITEHTFVVKKEKKKPTYLPTSKIVGQVRGNRNIFNCGLIQIHRKHWTQDTEWRQIKQKTQHRKQKSWATQITSKTKPLFFSQTIAFHFLNLEKQIVKRQHLCHFAVKSKIFIIL
jgi:hypothetical protein